MKLEPGKKAREFAHLFLRRAGEDRVTVEMHEEHPAAPSHQTPGRNRGVDPTGEQARHAPAHAHGHAAGPAFLAEIIERVVRQRFDMDGELRLVEIDQPALRLLDAAADLALDLRRGHRKPLVGSAGRHTERPGGPAAEVHKNRARDRVHVERRASSLGKVGDTEHPGDAISNR